MQMFLEGKWQDGTNSIEVRNPFDQSVIDTVPEGTPEDIDRALATLVRGREIMRDMPAHERAGILARVSQLLADRQEEIAHLISSEEGKILAESRVEAQRAVEVMRLSAEEARRLTGDVVPLDAAPKGEHKFGFTVRIPCGIVAAITPFNFPLNLVAHKVGPAIAGGNAVIIKPASDTPLSALKLAELFLEAGLPPEAIACIPGSGGKLGKAICEDPRVRKISFTGSYEVGEAICKAAGLKKVTMELGSNSPVIIMDDADLEVAAKAVSKAGFSNAGQVCISAQRILTSARVRSDFADLIKSEAEAVRVGDQLKDDTDVGPMIRLSDAERVESWIKDAVEQGHAKVLAGGSREGSLHAATVLDDVNPSSRVSRDELFGPAIALTYFEDVDEAIRLANDTEFGLAASIFTQDIDRAMKFALQVESGNLHINWSTQWRADNMPYGGLKHSGMGKEGPAYAVKEMTEEKMVVMHLK